MATTDPTPSALDLAAQVLAATDALRARLVKTAPDPETAADVRRLIGEADHYVACALAAAGAHPTARAVVEKVRPAAQPPANGGA